MSPASPRRRFWCGAAILVIVSPAHADEAERLGLYAIELRTGGVEQVAVEPLPGYTYCGSPSWAPDGERILFDATPGKAWHKTRIFVSDPPAKEARKAIDLGPGNCPTSSPDGGKIAFRLNAGAVPDAQPGIWIMNADGGERRRLADGDLPKWSPDGRRVLSVSFSNPCRLTLIDVESGGARAVELAGHVFYSVPSWAGDGTIVAVIRSRGPASIALVDVSDPQHAKASRTLWARSDGPNVDPTYPVYAPTSQACVFVGRSTQGATLCVLRRPGLPQSLEQRSYDGRLLSLAITSDGERVLFCSNLTASELRGASSKVAPAAASEPGSSQDQN